MYKEINDLLQQLFLEIQSILSDQLVGMYLGGSLSNDHFNCETSDIDCYIIIIKPLSKLMIDKIEEMHKKFYISERPYAKKIEVSYIPKNDLLNFDPKNTRPYFNEGNFYLAHYGSNFMIELSVLRENGITIAGPDIRNLIKEISIQDLRHAIKRNLCEYWEVALNDLSKFKRSDYQIFAILTMCRTLYSLETSNIVSKSEAAKWAMDKLDDNWKNLIEKAISWKPDDEFNKLEETRQFVKYVLDKSHNNL